jgi:hypothetical protein
MENSITTKEIFEANQVLTLEVAKTLIGKKIAITNSEYKYNTPDVRIFTLDSIQSEWDLAASDPLEGYTSRQEYWNQKLSNRKEDFINNLKLVSKEIDIQPYATCDLKDSWTFTTPTFFGSDSDREIYYIEIPTFVTVKGCGDYDGWKLEIVNFVKHISNPTSGAPFNVFLCKNPDGSFVEWSDNVFVYEN